MDTVRSRARGCDCERLDLADGSFDVVSSTLGIMFAPDHEAVACELARVLRPGGRLALATWTPTSGIADMFKLMAPFQPAPPPSNPFEWGDETTLADALGERREQLHSSWVEFFETNHRTYGQITHSREYLLVLGERH